MVYTVRVSAMDMRTTQSCWGVIDTPLAAALAVQVAKDIYGFATGTYGPSTEAKKLDIQMGIEKAKTSFPRILAGTDVVGGAGKLEWQATISMPQMLLDEELFASLRRATQGVVIDDDELAVDVVDEIGPKGQYLVRLHTLARFRRAVEPIELFDRSFRRSRQQRGRPQVMEKVVPKMDRILAQRRVPPLTSAQLGAFGEIACQAEQTLHAVES